MQMRARGLERDLTARIARRDCRSDGAPAPGTAEGQSIEVKVFCGGKSSDISLHTDVFDSSGKSGGDNDMQGNSGFANTKAGDYTIIVTPSGKDERRRGRFVINVSVT